MEMIKISVRNLVEFILREGDIDNRRGTGAAEEAMQEGSRMHRKIQSSQGSSYRAEVSLSELISFDDFCLTVEGRADGIITEKNKVTVDEIKCMYKNVYEMKEPIAIHLAQAKCYAYIYAKQNELKNIGVQMTYCNLETEYIKRFKDEYSFEELSKWFLELVEKYSRFAKWEIEHKRSRDASIYPLCFPFEYRKGQKEMTASVYHAIGENQKLFVQAPTGIGKTMAAIFPSVKAIGEGKAEKLFYLTAKTALSHVAIGTFNTLAEKGLDIVSISITAKEKCCPWEVCECNPDACPYAKGHYDRVNDAMLDIIDHERMITFEDILSYAEKHQVCPFEFELDVSLFSDAVICDYNYVFDPTVCLKRYFGEGNNGQYIFLVDEAHNLVDRARSMYSAPLYKENFLEVKKILNDDFKERFGEKEKRDEYQRSKKLDDDMMKTLEGNEKRLALALDKCNKLLLNFKRQCEGYKVIETASDIAALEEFYMKLLTAMSAYSSFLEKEKDVPEREKVLELYFDLMHFTNMYEVMNRKSVVYYEQLDQRFMIKLFNVDPSDHLMERLEKARATIFFSATMLPIHYYKELLTGSLDTPAIYLNSPFDPAKRRILIGRDVSSLYKRRTREEYLKYAAYIRSVCGAKKGNYMVFFPSYRMLLDCYEALLTIGIPDGLTPILQTANMTETERKDFLLAFEKEDDLLAFCILGGIFSEGIDLTGEKLIGALIVGTGIPMVCNENEILKNHFDEMNGNGFDYAYRYPGMNKVSQAAGRVIRTEEDRGVICLLDERFVYKETIKLFPSEWSDYIVVDSWKIERAVMDFWDQK